MLCTSAASHFEFLFATLSLARGPRADVLLCLAIQIIANDSSCLCFQLKSLLVVVGSAQSDSLFLILGHRTWLLAPV